MKKLSRINSRALIFGFTLLFLPILAHGKKEDQTWEEHKYELSLDSLRGEVLGSELYQSFMNQAQQTAQFDLLLRESLASLTQTTAVSPKAAYQGFLVKFREALSTFYYKRHASDQSLLPSVALAQQIAFWIFTSLNLNTYTYEITKHIATQGGYDPNRWKSLIDLGGKSPEQISTKSAQLYQLLQILQETPVLHESIKAGRSWFQRSLAKRWYVSYLGGVTWESLDLHLSGSLPSIKMQAQDALTGKPALFLRMSSPTIGSNSDTRLAPEFEAYLAHLKRLGLQHTYFNFQDNRELELQDVSTPNELIKLMGINYEAYRTKVLEDLPKTLGPEAQLKVYSLSKNNPFYRGKDVSGDMDREEFLKHTLSSLVQGSKSGYMLAGFFNSLPERQQFESRLRSTLEFLFPFHTTLTKQERRIFVDVLYLLLVDTFGQGSQLANLTCKDGIDRAGGTNALLYLVLLLNDIVTQEGDQGLPPDRFFKLAPQVPAMLFGDALALRKREILPAHAKRFTSAGKYILARFLDSPEWARQWARGFHFRRVSFEG